MKRFLVSLVVLSLTAAGTLAADWPQFRGPQRDGLSAEAGLLQAWPEAGPKVLWENSDLGFGWASAAIVKGVVYTTGNVGDDVVVTALDPGGKKLWQTPIDKNTGGGGHKGARCTPVIDGDMLYVESDAGSVFGLKTSDGSKVWSKNLAEEYGAKAPQWFYAESLLVDGDRVFACPGGKSPIVALNKKDGKLVWAAEALEPPRGQMSDSIEYLGKQKQILGFTGEHAFGVDAETGKLLWSYAQKNKYSINATPAVFQGDVVYITCGYKLGGTALKLAAADGKVTATKLWANPTPDDQDGGVVLVDGKIFGTGHMGVKGLSAVDLAKGDTLFTNKNVGQGSIVYADGRLYCAGQSGEVCLCDPKADGKIVSKFTIAVKQKGEMWAHPAIADGKLYLRHDSTMTVYDIKAAPAAK